MLSSSVHHHLARSLPPLHAARRLFTNGRCLRYTEATQKVHEPTLERPKFAERLGRPQIKNQILFFVFGSSLAFSYAAWRTNLETEAWATRLAASTKWTEITSADLRRLQQIDLVKNLRGSYTLIQDQASQIPQLLRPWISGLYLAFAQPYADASDGRRLCWKLCLLNAGVWVAWNVSRLQPMMIRSFMHHPLSGLSYTMLTSTFSHRSIIHLLANCLALESFGSCHRNTHLSFAGSSAAVYLSQSQSSASPDQLESTSAYHFLAFYLSAGIFASLVSHTVTVKFKYPRLISRLSSPANAAKPVDTWQAAVSAVSNSAASATRKAAASSIMPSLGASGAIYACVTMTALAFPNGQIALTIPPSYPIDIQLGVGALLALDVLGVIRGWRFFDHFAHLGGAAFGVAYYTFGPTFWTYIRGAGGTKKSDQKEE
ncbi:uncharacterized protein BT62DRAFT_1029602 [Guyanagaster necrorhizus]|uniref:Peptidase S54 rhomboid domain-containing protein n=1 Tax=Guyanagaster necrorhizus TaxID=856835 RepID=A0A9P7VPW9_9AGAR|nr:uncharacterized protein BT62DRAFT_1029602 [Guyanagaster necrorhizus MCA 3950]KAG7444432.1 hypothetical protein BT62DRAFT_1029602 [Guyanagaster necrorhizus MCA 3950]